MKKTLYENGRIAVDPVIFTIRDKKLFVYLHSREIEPYKGMGELPGGLLLINETSKETLSRKLVAVFGLEKVFLEQFHTFTQPDRDPRVRTVSIAYIALVSEDKVRHIEHFVAYDTLGDLAFDHKNIVSAAHSYLVQNLNKKFAQQFLPKYFPLNDLQMVYEVVTKKEIDNRNFRKKVLSSGIIAKTTQVQKYVTHRPALLYKFIENT